MDVLTFMCPCILLRGIRGPGVLGAGRCERVGDRTLDDFPQVVNELDPAEIRER